MSKKLNTSAITNELANSSFFPGRPSQPKKEERVAKPATAPVVLDPVHPVEERPVVSPVGQSARKPVAKPPSAAPAAARRFVRRTFDYFEDQVAFITKESLEERLAGNDVSMNSILREALDDWIKKRTSRK